MLTFIKNILIFTSISLFISSCSTLNKDECKTANWESIGYEDGTKGYPASRVGKHRSACAEYGIQPNLNSYTSGRKKGLSHFCIPSTAYNRGSRGYNYNGVCSGYNEKEFLNAYYEGREVYKARSVLSGMKNDYQKEERYIISLERELHEKEHIIVSGRLTKVKALILLNETKDIAEELGKAKSNLLLLEEDISRQSQHVSYLVNNNSYR